MYINALGSLEQLTQLPSSTTWTTTNVVEGMRRSGRSEVDVQLVRAAFERSPRAELDRVVRVVLDYFPAGNTGLMSNPVKEALIRNLYQQLISDNSAILPEFRVWAIAKNPTFAAQLFAGPQPPVPATPPVQPATPPVVQPAERRADYTLAAKLAFGAAAIGVLLYWMDKKGY